ncbi:MAG: hypothetical protein RBR74_05360 [Ignavibacteriaceae bacterium]|jgi:hypothetical protein|nr:hypothetical protein [Ignavibacteriaceae bacterium]
MNQNAIYIFSPLLFASGDDNLLNNFNENDSNYFRATLYLNLIENILRKKDKTDFFIILSKDEIYPELEAVNDFKLITSEQNSIKVLQSEQITKEFVNHKYNILVAGNVVNLSSSDIDKYLNLLGIDVKTVLISKSSSNKISVFGFCGYTEELLRFFIESELSIQKFLGFNESCEYYITLAKDLFEVKDIDDFKKLYLDLSQKASLEYCSQNMHERFTHLFVEYKDLLK